MTRALAVFVGVTRIEIFADDKENEALILSLFELGQSLRPFWIILRPNI